jgi:hypothetical protein
LEYLIIDSQCYTQVVEVAWLEQEIQKRIDSYNGRSPVNHACQAGLNQVLDLLKRERQG